MELLLKVIFACPKCWRVLGGMLVSVSGSFLFGGLAVLRRVDRIESRAGSSIAQQVDQALASVPLPTTALGFAFSVFCILLGFAMIQLGKWAQKL